MTARKDLFGTAKTVKKEEPKLKDKIKSIMIGRALDIYVLLDTLCDFITENKTKYYNLLKEEVMNQFIAETLENNQQPANFKGIGVFSEAICELRRRGINKPLNKEEVAVLRKAGVSFDRVTTIEETPETFYFNPEIVLDQFTRDKISLALSLIPELKDKDLILKNEAIPKKVELVVSDKTLQDIGNKITSSKELKEMYQLTTMIAIRAKATKELVTDDILKILKKCGVNLSKEKGENK